ncbi:hypothetical protein SAMN05428966_10270 [Massilia sp. PDC64]|nr:hypothetical protein [Massilia sp. PDC64]SDC66612.1 hypothetical protein SAMN05428966_10270 [Massilia sp. PDC64]
MPTIGTCSICHGPVQTPELWSGDVPPTPTCGNCGAKPKNPYGPVIDMVRERPLPIPPLAQRGGWKP